ncbi:kinase-like domain-containing protein [Crucibulum laeve]|uniref:Kinase-like domain-containing protein n=1 Tax=Crucibulum laeve TaxID=68775 RepID=A0A5C3M3E5_9AGAR|nr:kinase-like domain-containing protein [Crucibulum laeve]
MSKLSYSTFLNANGHSWNWLHCSSQSLSLASSSSRTPSIIPDISEYDEKVLTAATKNCLPDVLEGSVSQGQFNGPIRGTYVCDTCPVGVRHPDSPRCPSQNFNKHPCGSALMDNDNGPRGSWDNQRDLTSISGTQSIQRSRSPIRKRSTLDEVTQTSDLTAEITIISEYAVAYGGFSDIYLGVWDDGYSPLPKIAIKLLRAFTRQDVDLDRARKRLNREVNVWKRLQHPNIAEFLGVSFPMGGRPALVMRWYENGTAPEYLKLHLDANKFRFVLDVASGLEYLHTRQPPVIHGDLKGNNTLVSDDSKVVLTDFGLSRLVEELTVQSGNTTNSIAGSIRWQAPELIFDEPEEGSTASKVTFPGDIYALGSTIYELLTGHIPYYSQLLDWVVIQHISAGRSPVREDDRAILEEYPGMLDLINRCWALKPQDRPDITEVVRLLDDIGKRIYKPP